MPSVRLFVCCVIFLFAATANAAVPIKSHLDVAWAKPDGFTLTADIHVPEAGQKSYPVLIIYHGGGWLRIPKASWTIWRAIWRLRGSTSW